MTIDRLGPPRHSPNQALTPWQQLAREGMSKEQIEAKLGIPAEGKDCHDCPPGVKRVTFDDDRVGPDNINGIRRTI